MRRGEKGFTLIELLLAVTITFTISGAAAGAIFQVFKGMERNNDRITVASQEENAAHWISRDIQMADTVSANLTLSDFITVNWTTWDDVNNPIYYTVTYSLNLTDSAGKLYRLERTYLKPGEAAKRSAVARYIYYDPDNTDNTSTASYASPALTLWLTAIYNGSIEKREYKVKHRPNF